MALADVRRFYADGHERVEAARRRHHYYHDYLTRILRVRVPAGQRVLDRDAAPDTAWRRCNHARA